VTCVTYENEYIRRYQENIWALNLLSSIVKPHTSRYEYCFERGIDHTNQGRGERMLFLSLVIMRSWSYEKFTGVHSITGYQIGTSDREWIRTIPPQSKTFRLLHRQYRTTKFCSPGSLCAKVIFRTLGSDLIISWLSHFTDKKTLQIW
jgi:hypothetical protein